MRLTTIFIFALIFLLAGFTQANSQNSSALPDSSMDGGKMLSLSDDDDDTTWPLGPNEWVEEEEQGEEEEPVEQVTEEEQGTEESQDENIDEESSQEETQAQEESSVEDESVNQNRDVSDAEWEAVPGVKVPFFFLVDASGDESEDEIAVVDLKALKYAGQILEGIPFTYDVSSGDVYLTENIGSLPENIRYVEEIFYAGVARYDYEVAQPQVDYDTARDAQRVVVVAEKGGETIASAFESTRSEAFMKAVQNAAQHIKRKINKGQNQVTGVIKAWEFLNEGYVQENESFYIELRAWVAFDGFEE